MIDRGSLACSCASRWYAVQARPKQEERAAANLLTAGVTTFLPMIRQAWRTRSASAVGKAPLFPRYLFVQCDIGHLARKIRYTRGVAKVLGTLDGPTPVDDAIIASIRSRIGEDGYVQLTPTLEPGDPVEVMAGPLRGFVGIFHAGTPATQRVVLLLHAMNSQMRVVVDSNIIRRVSA
jgi:transcriptional antiterminator RfaH